MLRHVNAVWPTLCVFVACSCGPTAAPSPVDDDAGMDGSVRDAGRDASDATAEQRIDAGGRDEGVVDADIREVSIVRDTGPDTNCQETDPVRRMCSVACGANPTRCDDNICASGTRCILNGCGPHCVPRGAPCADPLDCGSNSRCVAYGGRSQCEAITGECSDSRDCPAGHFCELQGGEMQCVDRRIACDPNAATSCPLGYQCANPHGGQAICVRAHVRCATPTACPSGSSCTEMIPGASLCVRPGTCSTIADCRGQLLACGADPMTGSASCQRHGPCNFPQDCAPGMQCRDLTGESPYAVGECVEPTPPSLPRDACQTNRDCEPGKVCATQRELSYPVCIASPVLML